MGCSNSTPSKEGPEGRVDHESNVHSQDVIGLLDQSSSSSSSTVTLHSSGRTSGSSSMPSSSSSSLNHSNKGAAASNNQGFFQRMKSTRKGVMNFAGAGGGKRRHSGSSYEQKRKAYAEVGRSQSIPGNSTTRKRMNRSTGSVFVRKREWLLDEQEHQTKEPNKYENVIERLNEFLVEEGLQRHTEFTRKQMKTIFRKLVNDSVYDDLLFDKIFGLFDANNNGLVEKADFFVAMTFLTQKGSATDNIALAFRLFDVDANGSMCQNEFNTMICSILSNRLKYALATDYGKQSFKEHMKQEWSAESVEFWETVNDLCCLYQEHGDAEIPVSVAQRVFQQYISHEAPDQINIASRTHDKIHSAIKNSQEAGQETVPMESFLHAAEEIMQLMEQDNFERFRSTLAKKAKLAAELDPDVKLDYAQQAWQSLGLAQDVPMTMQDFRKWAIANPGYFTFLDEIQNSFKRLIHSKTEPLANTIEPSEVTLELITPLSSDGNSPKSRSSVSTPNNMPKRLYKRAATSLVTVSTEVDEDGQEVRIITIGTPRSYQSHEDTVGDLPDFTNQHQHVDMKKGIYERNYSTPLPPTVSNDVHLKSDDVNSSSKKTRIRFAHSNALGIM